MVKIANGEVEKTIHLSKVKTVILSGTCARSRENCRDNYDSYSVLRQLINYSRLLHFCVLIWY